MRDNIFDSDCDAIVNTVNCVGVMGGGLAKQFRLRYWDMNKAYQIACAESQVKVGKMWQWWESPKFTESGDWIEGRWIINFPTKDDWRNPSKLDYISDGLIDLVSVIGDLHLKSIAIPPLGCGLGGLHWDVVLPMIKICLSPITHFTTPPVRVDIYPPEGKHYTL